MSNVSTAAQTVIPPTNTVFRDSETVARVLEMRLLSDGITVTRTASDLVRYHDKLMIIDRQTLFLLGFNYTYLDVDRSRSFGRIRCDSHDADTGRK